MHTFELKMIWAVVIALMTHYLLIILATSKDYGPFDLKIRKAEFLKGPKLKNCATVKVDLWEDNKGFLVTTVISKNFFPQVGIVTAISKGKELVRIQMNNPCEHLFLRPLLNTVFNATQRCVLKKGTYIYGVNIEKLANEFFGGSFAYGNLTFKSAMYSRDCNMFALNLDVSISPKESN